MIPAILFFGFSLFAAACTKKPEPEPSLPNIEPVRDPQVDYFHQKLSRDFKIADEEINKGCHYLDYIQRGGASPARGYGGDVIPCEVYEYVLDNYPKFPALTEELTGKPIPWVLDDLDDATDFDQKTRAKVKVAIAKVTQILGKEKVEADSAFFKETMAIALFFFVMLPETKEAIQANKTALLRKTQRIDGDYPFLKEFRDYLLENGGLGLFSWEADAPLEASAIEALKLHKGWSSERSKVLFAVFRLAKLDPYFIFVKGWEAPKSFGSVSNQAFRKQSQDYGHVIIGCNFGKDPVKFDTANFELRPLYDLEVTYPFRLIHMAALDKAHRGNDLLTLGRAEDAEKVLYEAMYLDPRQPLVFMFLSRAFLKRGQKDKSLVAAKRAIDLAPKSSQAHRQLFQAYDAMGRKESALTTLEAAVKLVPLDASLCEELGDYAVGMGGEEKIERAITAYSAGLKSEPHSASLNLKMANLMKAKGKLPEYEAHLRSVVRHSSAMSAELVDSLYQLGIHLCDQGKAEEGKPLLRRAMAFPSHSLAPRAEKCLDRPQ